MVLDSGSTQNIVKEGLKALLDEPRSAKTTFKMLSGKLENRHSTVGKLGILLATSTKGNYNLVSPQMVLATLRKLKRIYKLVQEYDGKRHFTTLYDGDRRLFEFATSGNTGSTLMYLTTAALQFLEIEKGVSLLNEISASPIPVPASTQSTDWRLKDKTEDALRRLGPLGYKRLKQLVKEGRIAGLDITEAQLEEAKSKVDAQFLRVYGGKVSGRKSDRIEFQEPEPLSTWFFDQIVHKTTSRNGHTHATIFYSTGELGYMIAYPHRGLKEMPKIVRLWMERVKEIRNQLNRNKGEIILVDNTLIRNHADRVGIKVLYGDMHKSNDSKALREIAIKEGVAVHLFPQDSRNALHKLDSAMSRLMKMVETALMNAKLGQEFWSDALVDAVYRFNRLPGAKNAKSAFEKLWGVPPHYKSFFPSFGATSVFSRGDGKGKNAEGIFLYRRTDASAVFYWPELNSDVVRANYQCIDGIPKSDRLINMWLGNSVLHNQQAEMQPTFRHCKTKNAKIYDLLLQNRPFKCVFNDQNTLVRFECGVQGCDFRTRYMKGLKTHISTKHTTKTKDKNEMRMQNEIHRGKPDVHQIPRWPFVHPTIENLPLIGPNETDSTVSKETFPVQSGRDMENKKQTIPKETKSILKRSHRNKLLFKTPNKAITWKDKLVEFNDGMPRAPETPPKGKLGIAALKRRFQDKVEKFGKESILRRRKLKAKKAGPPRRSKRKRSPNPRYSQSLVTKSVEFTKPECGKEPECRKTQHQVEGTYVVSESNFIRGAVSERDKKEMLEANAEVRDKQNEDIDVAIEVLLSEKCKVGSSRVCRQDSRADCKTQEKELQRRLDKIWTQARQFEKEIQNKPGEKRTKEELPGFVDPLEDENYVGHEYPKHEPRYVLVSEASSVIGENGNLDSNSEKWKTKEELNWGDEEEDPVAIDPNRTNISEDDRRRADEVCAKITRANVKNYEPKSIARALKGPLACMWLQGLEKELNNINSKGSFSKIQRLNEDHVILRTQWVFKIVINEDGSLKFKCRLVIRGDLQKDDSIPRFTESPVVESLSICILLAIAGLFGLACYTADIDGAYLTAKFKGAGNPVVIKCPQGCITSNGSPYLRLHRNLYGSKQGAAVFFSKLLQVMVGILNYTQSNYDPCVLFKFISGSLVIVAVYVDDLLILCKPEIFEEVISEIGKDIKPGKGHFKMKHYGRVPEYKKGGQDWVYYLGRQLAQCYETCTIYVNQSHKIMAAVKQILGDYSSSRRSWRTQRTPVSTQHMMELKTVKLPVNDYEKGQRNKEVKFFISYFKNQNVTTEKVIAYMRMLVGILGYLAINGIPEITTVTNMLARYQLNPSTLHVKVATAVFQYLYTIKDDVCVYGSNGSVLSPYILWGFSDASYGDAIESMRSTAGHCVFFFGNLLTCKSYVLKSVCRSVTEAEIKAMSEATAIIEYIRNWLQDEIVPRLKTLPESEKFNLNCVKQTPIAYREKPFTLSRLKEELKTQQPLMALLGYDNSATRASVVHNIKKKLRHVRIHASYIHYAFHVQKSIVIVKMPTAVIPSDLFTKLFTKQSHERLTRVVRNQMSKRDVQDFDDRSYKYDFPRLGTDESLIVTNEENVDRLLALLAEEEASE